MVARAQRPRRGLRLMAMGISSWIFTMMLTIKGLQEQRTAAGRCQCLEITHETTRGWSSRIQGQASHRQYKGRTWRHREERLETARLSTPIYPSENCQRAQIAETERQSLAKTKKWSKSRKNLVSTKTHNSFKPRESSKAPPKTDTETTRAANPNSKK